VSMQIAKIAQTSAAAGRNEAEKRFELLKP
jgi:hypothetical protein